MLSFMVSFTVLYSRYAELQLHFGYFLQEPGEDKGIFTLNSGLIGLQLMTFSSFINPLFYKTKQNSEHKIKALHFTNIKIRVHKNNHNSSDFFGRVWSYQGMVKLEGTNVVSWNVSCRQGFRYLSYDTALICIKSGNTRFLNFPAVIFLLHYRPSGFSHYRLFC